ncbi:MAG: hypothetical protein ABSH32_19035 [Bryobacteraceae bacterium]|jgi:hypothetical protein
MNTAEEVGIGRKRRMVAFLYLGAAFFAMDFVAVRFFTPEAFFRPEVEEATPKCPR